MPAPKLTRDILLAALAGFQLDKQRIDSQIAEVQAMLDGTSATVAAPARTKTRGKRSAAVRRRMAEAQKARWAKIKGQSEAAPLDPVKAKRGRPQKAAVKKAAGKRSAVKKTARAKAARKTPAAAAPAAA